MTSGCLVLLLDGALLLVLLALKVDGTGGLVVDILGGVNEVLEVSPGEERKKKKRKKKKK